MARNLLYFSTGLKRGVTILRTWCLLIAALSAFTVPVFASATSSDPGAAMVSRSDVTQAFTVSGNVTAENVDQLPGVSVIEKGTSNGTVTDTDGNYSFSVSSRDATLVFSFIGYANQEVPLNGRAIVNITMSEDVVSLGEVVVVGYG